jgi:hypothetical protein
MIPRTKLKLDFIADCCLDRIGDECVLNATDNDGNNPARPTLEGWTSSNFLVCKLICLMECRIYPLLIKVSLSSLVTPRGWETAIAACTNNQHNSVRISSGWDEESAFDQVPQMVIMKPRPAQRARIAVDFEKPKPKVYHRLPL